MMTACYMLNIDGLIFWISIITILSPDCMLTLFSSTRGRGPVCAAGGSSTRSFCALLHRTDSPNRLLTTVGDVEICHEIQAMFLFPVVKVCSKQKSCQSAVAEMWEFATEKGWGGFTMRLKRREKGTMDEIEGKGGKEHQLAVYFCGDHA